MEKKGAALWNIRHGEKGGFDAAEEAIDDAFQLWVTLLYLATASQDQAIAAATAIVIA